MYKSYAAGLSFPGGFSTGITLLLIEAAILMLILRPHTLLLEHWLRFSIALILFVPWTLLLLMFAMHSGSIYMDHLSGLFKLDLFLLLFFIASVVARLYIGVDD